MKFKEIASFFLEIVQVVAVALIIVLPIRYFVFQPFIVKGASMEPSFQSGDYLIIDELSFRLRDPQRGEVVVFRYPNEPSQRFIKRIIALPEEKITLKNNQITITDQDGQTILLDESEYLTNPLWSSQQEIVLDKDEYFVLGDNRQHSFDSRKWGAVERESIIGRVIIRAWPPTALAMIAAPEY